MNTFEEASAAPRASLSASHHFQSAIQPHGNTTLVLLPAQKARSRLLNTRALLGKTTSNKTTTQQHHSPEPSVSTGPRAHHHRALVVETSPCLSTGGAKTGDATRTPMLPQQILKLVEAYSPRLHRALLPALGKQTAAGRPEGLSFCKKLSLLNLSRASAGDRLPINEDAVCTSPKQAS